MEKIRDDGPSARQQAIYNSSFFFNQNLENMEAYSTLSINHQQTDRKPGKFFEYYKTVLDKVSFDYNLFAKEYRKAVNVLAPEETAALNAWIRSSAAVAGLVARLGTSDEIVESSKMEKQQNS
jgi:hypothetical protein